MADQSKVFLTPAMLLIAFLAVISVTLTAGLLTDYEYLPFALIFAAIWLVINLKYQYVGLLVYSIFILIRPHEFISFLQVPFPIEKALAAPVALGLMISMIKEHGPVITYNRIDKTVVAFMVVTLASVATSIWIQGAWAEWQQLLRLFIIYIFISRIIKNKRQLRIYILFFILTTAFHAFSATINYYRGIREFEMGIERAMGMDSSYGDPNSLAATIVYTLPFIYYYTRGVKSLFSKALMAVIFGVCLWTVVLTGSRTGMTGIGFLLILTLFQFGNKFRNIAIAVVLVLGIFIIMPDQYKERLYSTTDLSGDTGASMSAQGRIDGFLYGVRMMIRRPLLGVGIGMYSIAHGSIYGKGYWEAHNLPGQLFGDLGILGTIAFIAWMAAFFKSFSVLKRHYRDPASKDNFMFEMVIAMQLQLLCLFYMGLGGHNLYRFNWFILAALTTVMINLAFRERAQIARQAESEMPVSMAESQT